MLTVSNDPLTIRSPARACLGFDYGASKIGVALGELTTGTIHPLTTLQNIHGKPDWQAISNLVANWQPQAFIVGISYQGDGSASPLTRKIERFCRQLEGRYRLPVHTVDERLSSYEAKSMLGEELNLSPTKVKQLHDRIAALCIIRTWMNQQPTNSDEIIE